MTANAKYSKSKSLGGMSSENSQPSTSEFLFSLVTAPRFRRYIVVYFCLLCLCVVSWFGWISPRLTENDALSRSVDPLSREKEGGWFGSNALPKFANLVYVRSLDPSLLPGDTELAEYDSNRKRLVIVGDVHGCLDELERLLEQVSFNSHKGDHLIFAGDIIAKGPKSPEVVDLARKYSASCVRGNNEDRVLLTRRALKAAELTKAGSKDRATGNIASDSADEDAEDDSKEHKLGRQLSDEQAEWLETCPVILKVGGVKGMGEVVVVHGGLVPGVDLENQDPSVVMTMRTIDLSTHVPSASSKGVSWTKLFNKYQNLLATSRESALPGDSARYSSATTVIYGHDAKKAPVLNTYTKGLDTGCYKGQKLTAMVIGDGGYNHIEQVKCQDHRKKG